jgi:hypothetical protein
VKIAACYPRAVKWLFAAAGSPLAANQTEVVNLRALSAGEACNALFATDVTPNLPPGKSTPADAPSVPEPSAAT